MLRILDRYVIRSFLYSYLVCGLALVGLTLVLDAFMRIKDFLEAAHASVGSGLGVLTVMLEYYSARLPVFFHTVSPAILLTAAMFCLAQLNKNNELVPMRASGISLFRTLTPLFLFAVLITGALVIDQEYIIPALVPKIKYTESLLEGGADSIFTALDLDDEQGNNWDIRRYERSERRITENLLIRSRYPDSLSTRVFITAKEAKWRRSDSDRIPRWHLYDGIEIRRDRDGNRITPENGNYDAHFDVYVVLRPHDKSDDPFHIVSSFTDRDIVPEDIAILHQSSAKLQQLLYLDPSRRDIAVALHSRYAFPFSNLVLLLLGLPFVLGTESKGTFGGLVVCVIICAAFYGVLALCTELGKDELSPALAAWLPIALFGPLGVFLFDGVKT